jgi:SAM-dependent methyltransferase
MAVREQVTGHEVSAPGSDVAMPIAVALFNDTGSSHHTGCLAVSQAHRAMLRRAGAVVRHAHFVQEFMQLGSGTVDEGIARVLASADLLRVFADVDAVVVNGEGTIHDVCGRHLLAILGAAQRLGLPTFLVNAVLQDIDDGRDVLLGVDDLTVREVRTSAYLDSIGIPHRVVVDSLFEAEFAETVCHDFAGKLIITDCHARRAGEFAPQFEELRTTWGAQLAEYQLQAPERARDWQHAVADFRPALAVVTGRHHGACVALRAGVPFVTFPSNTWKIEGVLDMLDGYPREAADLSRPIAERLNAAIAARDWFREHSASWDRQGKLDTFSGLHAVRSRPVRRSRAIAPPGISVANLRTLAAIRAVTTRGGAVLHVGAGDGALVRSLLSEGLSAHGIELSRCAVAALDAAPNGRFSSGAPESLPVADDAFSTVVADSGWLEHLEPDELTRALAELARVAADTVIVETTGRSLRRDAATGTIRSREWWERRLLELGLRRHPRLFALTTFEALEDETGAACVIMQKLPSRAAAAHPLPIIAGGFDGRQDLLRETGRRSDAHLARYRWACQRIAPGEVVVDVGCSLGYGTATLAEGSEASRVIGLDISEAAIGYARDCYLPGRSGLEFRDADVAGWDGWADASVDCIVAFETIQQLPDAERFLRGAGRVLKPGGRLLISIPSGHHVLGLDRVTDLVGAELLVDEVYAQSGGNPPAGSDSRRRLQRVVWPDVEPSLYEQAEFWLLTAFRDPLAGGGLLLGSHQVRSTRLRQTVAQRWLDASSPHSADMGAALCTLAYCALDALPDDRASDLLTRIADYRAYARGDAEVEGWRLALTFVEGMLRVTLGDLDEAERCLQDCGSSDASAPPLPLEARLIEASALARAIAVARADRDAAERLAVAQGELARLQTIIEDRNRALEAGDIRMALLEAAIESVDVQTWIWGAGSGGERLLHWLHARRAHIAGVVDSDPGKEGGTLLGVPIVSPETLRARLAPWSDARLIIASIHHDEIRGRVQELGLSHARPMLVAPGDL